MRWIVIPVWVLGGAFAAFGQAAAPADQVAAMAEIEHFLGVWEGSGWQQRGPDPAGRVEFEIREEVEATLDGLVYLVRGLGTTRPEGGGEPYPIHQALATIHWSGAQGVWEFQTHTAEGHHTVTELERLEDGTLRWGFDVPQGAVRFTIDLSADRWHEIGEITFDGTTWLQFHEMTLERVGG